MHGLHNLSISLFKTMYVYTNHELLHVICMTLSCFDFLNSDLGIEVITSRLKRENLPTSQCAKIVKAWVSYHRLVGAKFILFCTKIS